MNVADKSVKIQFGTVDWVVWLHAHIVANPIFKNE